MLLSALIGDNIGSNEDFRRGGPYEAAASFWLHESPLFSDWLNSNSSSMNSFPSSPEVGFVLATDNNGSTYRSVDRPFTCPWTVNSQL